LFQAVREPPASSGIGRLTDIALFPENIDMADTLTGRKVAVLATDGFEYVELTKPIAALREAGAETTVVSLKPGKIQGYNHDEKGDAVTVEATLPDANPDEFDGLLLPGGVANPDKLRMNDDAVEFVRAFVDADKPIAAICHGPWTLIEAGAVEGKRMTSWPSLRSDLINAGVDWVDEAVVVDGRLVTSRKPDDLPAFNERIVPLFAGRR
jgi:protease I